MTSLFEVLYLVLGCGKALQIQQFNYYIHGTEYNTTPSIELSSLFKVVIVCPSKSVYKMTLI